jgi:hypothetical protein
MDTFLENAQRIFDVARSRAFRDNAGVDHESRDMAVMIRHDGTMHFVMDPPPSLDTGFGADVRTAYRVTRSTLGVRVTGRTLDRNCVLEERSGGKPAWNLLRDRPLYEIAPPLIASA